MTGRVFFPLQEEGQQSHVGSEASSRADVASTSASMGQQSSNNATAINVNVNRRFSRSGRVRSRGRTSPSLIRPCPGAQLSGSSEEVEEEEEEDLSEDSSSRRPMLYRSSPAIMQNMRLS